MIVLFERRKFDYCIVDEASQYYCIYKVVQQRRRFGAEGQRNRYCETTGKSREQYRSTPELKSPLNSVGPEEIIGSILSVQLEKEMEQTILSRRTYLW